MQDIILSQNEDVIGAFIENFINHVVASGSNEISIKRKGSTKFEIIACPGFLVACDYRTSDIEAVFDFFLGLAIDESNKNDLELEMWCTSLNDDFCSVKFVRTKQLN